MKILHSIFLAGMLLPGLVFAGDSIPFTPPPAPPQEYHSVNGENSSLPPSSIPATTTPAAEAAASASVDAADKSVSIVTNTQKEITDLAQNTLGFEQQADQRIQDLVDSNRAMGAAIQTLTQNVMELQQKLAQGSTSNSSATGFLHTLRDPETESFLLGAAAILLLLSGVLLGRLWRSRTRVKLVPVVPVSSAMTVSTSTPDPSESEYDFMSTSQAIPAKLDLARSYIAMNDLEQARTILKTVIEKGDDSQRKEAGQLLQKLMR